MTLSTSLVAVWYSSDSWRSRVRACNSPSSRAFSIAITACAAKFSSSTISLSENARTSVRNALIKPSRAPSLRSGTSSAVRASVFFRTTSPHGLFGPGSNARISRTWTKRSPSMSICRPRFGGAGSRPNAVIESGQPCVAAARKFAPSYSINDPIAAPQSACALCRIVSNTGATSPGLALITCNTSDVAVCSPMPRASRLGAARSPWR